MQTAILPLHTQHFVQSTSLAHTSTQSHMCAQALCQGRLTHGFVVACKAWKHLSMPLSKAMPEAAHELSTLWAGQVIQGNGFHSPPGKPFFCPLEPPKGMFAHQPSCSHGGDPQLHSTSMEILLSAVENSDPVSPGCRGLERVAKEG